MAKERRNQTINKQVAYYKRAMDEESIPEEQNPASVVQVFSTELLLQIALGKLDLKPFAIHELKSRGLDKKGTWVGFDQAEAIWEKLKQAKTQSRRHI